MQQFNVRISDETKEKVDWLSEVMGEPAAYVGRYAIERLYQEKKAEYQDDKDFLDWLKSRREDNA